MIEFDWYRSFISVYRLGTTTAAAHARHLTQPAISQHLAALETMLGQPLFVRSPRKMLPTEAGKTLYQEISASVDTLEHSSLSLRAILQSQQQKIRLGTPLEYFYEVILPQLSITRVQLQVELGETEQLIQRLVKNQLDMVIATQQLPASVIKYEKFSEEVFLLVVSAQHVPPVFRDSIRHRHVLLEWLSEQTWISYSNELPIIRRFWRSVFKKTPDFRSSLVIPNLHAIGKAVSQGYGVSVLPSYLCQPLIQSGQIKILLSPEPAVKNDLWLAYRKDRTNDTVINLLRDQLKQTRMIG